MQQGWALSEVCLCKAGKIASPIAVTYINAPTLTSNALTLTFMPFLLWHTVLQPTLHPAPSPTWQNTIQTLTRMTQTELVPSHYSRLLWYTHSKSHSPCCSTYLYIANTTTIISHIVTVTHITTDAAINFISISSHSCQNYNHNRLLYLHGQQGTHNHSSFVEVHTLDKRCMIRYDRFMYVYICICSILLAN